ncbi:GntR family transcriptional regulator [Acidovorax sp. Leaf76]|nr:GntR family transcriptional regulator [Acidovorax sp. Leaf76]KQO31769.1 GntR family transcriptional regulator [Acidovorax sp. Leaf84]KQS28830.1 GntR family transcriptional regulator [Acidovorax sp. Leaf191]
MQFVVYCIDIMRSTASSPPDLDQFLDQLAHKAQPGERLPTIRELMKRFGASQMLVQRAFQGLKDRGLIDSQVGRGTYFRGTGAHRAAAAPADGERPRTPAVGTALPAVKSVLLLRRSISIARGRVLVEGLQRRLAAEGHRVLELSYNDPDHALTVLKGLPRFDACVVQSTFKAIPIALLAALRDKCEVLAVDGAALVGADVEAVGTEWGEPLAAAIEQLVQQGHRRIAYATTAHPYLATQLGRRRFASLQHTLPGVELIEITLDQLPHEDYATRLVQQLQASAGGSGALPFTALVAWGIEDGALFQRLLTHAGIAVPAQLSVVLLGRTDLANEHADFFDVVGCSVADQVEALHGAITARWADAGRPYGIHLTPVVRRLGASVAALA